MSFSGSQGGKESVTKETFSHHALPAAQRSNYPPYVLAGRQSELELDLMENMNRVRTGGTEAVARHLNQIVKVSFMNPRRRRRAAASQSGSR